MPFGNGGKPGRFSRRSKRPRWNTKLAVLALLGLAVCLAPAICRLQATFTAPTAVLNVKDAGAKGDGIADDTEAFRRTLRLAADSRRGAEVIVPAGTYLLRPDQPLPLGSHVSVRGQGSPVLKFTAAPDAGHGFEAIEIAGRTSAWKVWLSTAVTASTAASASIPARPTYGSPAASFGISALRTIRKARFSTPLFPA
ncbi:hypothetical protein HMSSN036_50830 [Paenibacillus macerans]|nr:hypothetical protein HMSSN036_50830 [Paenibacillus macerans]